MTRCQLLWFLLLSLGLVSCQDKALLLSDDIGAVALSVSGIDENGIRTLVAGAGHDLVVIPFAAQVDLSALPELPQAKVLMVSPLLQAEALDLHVQYPDKQILVLGNVAPGAEGLAGLRLDRASAMEQTGRLVARALEAGLVDSYMYIDRTGPRGDLLEPFRKGLGEQDEGQGVFVNLAEKSLVDYRDLIQAADEAKRKLLLVLPEGSLVEGVWDLLGGFRGYVISDIAWDYELAFSQPAVLKPAWDKAAEAYRKWYRDGTDKADIEIVYEIEVKKKEWRQVIEGLE